MQRGPPSSDTGAALRRAAVAVDRARGNVHDVDTVEAWRGLVSGQWSLVDRFAADGRRYLVARRNDARAGAPRPLSDRERQVLAFAARGHSNKHIAYALGLAPSTVSSHLRGVRRRLGVRDVAGLADLFFTPVPEDPS